MRRFWIHHVLPVAFVLVPVLLAGLVAAAVPADARRDYLARVRESAIDWVILALGSALFLSQTALAWRALRWRPDRGDFDTGADRWLAHLSQGAEWFPLLGLIGTVAAILQTFSAFSPERPLSQLEIIRKYAPAITATGSGLFMALANILPTWVVAVGRDLIRSLGGYAPPADDTSPVPPAVAGLPAAVTPVGANSARGGA
ncbi:MAG: MotA/TolQ/ExbB proton channel family protein [Gemmataceae bacterium]|nr:MotA/TolQ/ExbB proton channel family protein [Gemmataceae bacterium]